MSRRGSRGPRRRSAGEAPSERRGGRATALIDPGQPDRGSPVVADPGAARDDWMVGEDRVRQLDPEPARRVGEDDLERVGLVVGLDVGRAAGRRPARRRLAGDDPMLDVERGRGRSSRRPARRSAPGPGSRPSPSSGTRARPGRRRGSRSPRSRRARRWPASDRRPARRRNGGGRGRRSRGRA